MTIRCLNSRHSQNTSISRLGRGRRGPIALTGRLHSVGGPIVHYLGGLGRLQVWTGPHSDSFCFCFRLCLQRATGRSTSGIADKILYVWRSSEYISELPYLGFFHKALVSTRVAFTYGEVSKSVTKVRYPLKNINGSQS